ncbi:hypothetical protein E2C01_019281 [Portunus trituberculatus]|uniref:Ubiquitin-like domain-containing protein n=1 Tax=Portunus trituberculatus TaxID=210409 RepID=A0A5B7DXG5_PORTR|nr:hypothetical protein [Portunus trituberculatus]
MGNINAVPRRIRMSVRVQVLPAGTVLTLTVPSDMTVRELKAVLALQLPGFPAPKMFIVQDYRVLQDHQVVGAVLAEGSIVVLTRADNTR